MHQSQGSARGERVRSHKVQKCDMPLPAICQVAFKLGEQKTKSKKLPQQTVKDTESLFWF